MVTDMIFSEYILLSFRKLLTILCYPLLSDVDPQYPANYYLHLPIFQFTYHCEFLVLDVFVGLLCKSFENLYYCIVVISTYTFIMLSFNTWTFELAGKFESREPTQISEGNKVPDSDQGHSEKKVQMKGKNTFAVPRNVRPLGYTSNINRKPDGVEEVADEQPKSNDEFRKMLLRKWK